MYDYSGLPETLQDGMKRYVEEGIKAGGFLTACLENDLAGAINRADAFNLHRIQDIVHWIYNEAPSDCWGSREKVAEWVEMDASHTDSYKARWNANKNIGEINRDIKENLKRIEQRRQEKQTNNHGT